jgi:threonine aldolase
MVCHGAGFGGFYIALVDARGAVMLVDNSCDSAEHAARCAAVLAERLAETLGHHLAQPDPPGGE